MSSLARCVGSSFFDRGLWRGQAPLAAHYNQAHSIAGAKPAYEGSAKAGICPPNKKHTRQSDKKTPSNKPRNMEFLDDVKDPER
jgi:hypothetical protein